MHLEILTPDKTVFSGRIRAITVPGTKGPFTVLRNHAPIISTLDNGEMSFLTDTGQDQFFIISEGMIEVNKNRIIVLVEKIRTID